MTDLRFDLSDRDARRQLAAFVADLQGAHVVFTLKLGADGFTYIDFN